MNFLNQTDKYYIYLTLKNIYTKNLIDCKKTSHFNRPTITIKKYFIDRVLKKF